MASSNKSKVKKTEKVEKTDEVQGSKGKLGFGVKRFKFSPIFIVVFALVGVVLLGMSLADSQTTSTTTPACGKRLSTYNYQVPYGTSPWNTATCNLPLWNNSTTQAAAFGKRMYEYGQAWNATSQYWQDRIAEQKGYFMTQFGLNGDKNDYGTPIYYADSSFYDSTTKQLKPGKRIQIKLCADANCYQSNLDTARCDTDYNYYYQNVDCKAPNAYIPWDSSWKPSGSTDGNYLDDAGDKEMVIIDKTNGTVYELGRIDFDNSECIAADFYYALNGKSPENRLCGGANIVRDSAGKPINYYTYNQGTYSARGMGIQNSAMIVTPEEVEAGEIRHALTMEAFNTMYGPPCTADQLKNLTLTSPCGYAVAPATKHEWGHEKDILRRPSCTALETLLSDFKTKTTFMQTMTMDKLIPEGMRFKLNITDPEIDIWINNRADLNINHPDYPKNATQAQKDVTNQKARTARIFAVALRDYGWIVGDTTCYGAGFTVAGAANPVAKTQWAKLGITDSSSQLLLQGLFKADNILALEPPVSTCVDGTKTRFACTWTSSQYSAATTTTPTPTTPTNPTPTPTPTTPTTPPVTPTTPPTPVVTVKTVSLKQVPFPVEIRWNSERWEFHQAALISWTDSSSSANVPIRSYSVYKNGTKVYEGAAPQFTDFGVDSGTTYNYEIYATDTKGNKSNPLKHKARLDCSWWGLVCSFTQL